MGLLDNYIVTWIAAPLLVTAWAALAYAIITDWCKQRRNKPR